MTHSRFEALTFILGTITIAASAFLAPPFASSATEITAHLLLVVVLAGALHWGRNGGFLAALLAIAVYVVMRIPVLDSEGLSPAVLAVLGTRAAGYAALGIIGGEVSGRVKYMIARLQSESMIDPESGAFSARYAAAAIDSGIAQWQRYQTDFSVVRLEVARKVLATQKPSQSKELLRRIADQMRGDLRMVDDVAAETAGVFLVLLPRTNAAGAAVIADRLSSGTRNLLEAQASAVTATVFSTTLEPRALRSLAVSLGSTAGSSEGEIAQGSMNRAGDAAQDSVA